MAHHNQFVIRNDLSGSLALYIEPYGAAFPLARGEEVTVLDVFTAIPVTVTVAKEEGEPVLSIWPGDGDVTVRKDGIDVLELLQEGAGS